MSSVSNQIKISAFYVAVFNRAPDVSGLNYWLGQISGASADSVFDRLATGFTAHPAFTETYSSLNNVEFVNAIYTNVLGAEGDAKGVIYWTNKIVQDGWTRAEVISQFVQDSLEIDLSTGAAAWGLTDEEYAVAVSRQHFITNKANVALDFALVLGTDSNLDADTDTTTLDGLNSDSAFMASVAVLAAVTDDPQSAADAISLIHAAADSNDAITYILDNAPDYINITGERYTLSTNNEEVVGTRYNDLIVGSNVPSTFNVVDSIDGGDGVDTLQLVLQTSNLDVSAYVSNVERLNISAVQGDTTFYSDDVVLDMSHFDSSIEEINITDSTVGIQLLDQQSIANVNLRDLTGYNTNVTLDYDTQVVMGDADVLNISIDEVASSSGSYISVDTDIEQINITVLDGVSEESNLRLDTGATEVILDGGIVGQSVDINLTTDGGATFDSTAFVGDLYLNSGNLKVINTGAGDDDVYTSGWMDNADASFNLGEGDNTLRHYGAINGDITVGSGNDTLNLVGPIGATASINLGNGTNTLNAGVYFGVEDNVAGSIIGGSGADTVTLVGDLIDSGHIALAAGDNVLALDGAGGSSTITAGDGNNTVTLSESLTGSASITVGNGNNTVAIDDIQNNAALVFGNGNNTLNADQIATNIASTVNVTFGTGVNDLNANQIGGSGAATIVYGNGDGNSLNVTDNILNSSVTFGDGNTNIFTADQVISTTVRFGNGDNNTMTVNSINDAPDTVAFGNGNGNTLTVDGDINASTVTFGSGADNTLTVTDDVWSSTVTFGNGGAEMFVNDNVGEGAQITFGSGVDTLQLGTLNTSTYIEGNDVLTNINMGGGNDAVTITATNDGDTSVLVGSGAKINGGAGTNDVLTIEAVDNVDNVIDRDHAQLVTLTFSGTYQNGQVVSVTIDGELISYTIVNLVQGSDTEAAAIVAAGLNAAIEAAQPALTSTVDGNVITLEGSTDQDDVTVVSTGSTIDVVQIANTGISGFETLNLVALNPIVADYDVYDETADITANFEFITGVNTVNLINESAHIVTNHDPLLNGAYDEEEDGDAAVFTLENLNGNEAITVSSDEVTESLNLYVNRITVGADDLDHEVGDKLTFSYQLDNGDTEEYVFVVSSNDLNGATALADATNIATRLFNAIKNIPALSGVTFELDANQITLTAPDELALWTEINHTRAVDPVEVEGTTLDDTEITVGTYGTPETYDDDEIDHIVGDVITVTVGADQYSLTVTEADLFGANAYEDAVLIATRLASILEDGGETVSLDGNVIDIDTTDIVTLTDLRAQDDEIIGSTTSEVLNDSNNGDDTDADVVLNLNLATNTDNDVLDLTLNGTGNFDLEIIGDNQYETLELSITDGFSHYIDLGYEFSDLVTVTGAGAGQLIELEYLAATTVTANNAADYNIWQEVGVNDVVTVRTGAGDDYLSTTAEALFNIGSTVNLGAGNNTLGIYWNDSIEGDVYWQDYITGEMLADVSSINFAGNLNTLEIYENVELAAKSSTTLAMPAGGTGEVSELVLDSIIVSDHADDASLTITGTTTDFTLSLAYQGEDGGSLGQFNGVDGEDNVSGNEWSQINLNVVGVKDLNIISYDSINVELQGNTLENLTIESDENIALRIDGTTGADDGIQNQLTKLETISLDASTDVYLDIIDSHTDVSISTLIQGSQGEFILDVAYSDIGDIYTEFARGNGEDSIINISGTEESSVSVGNITVKPNRPAWGEDGNNNNLRVENNDGSTVTMGNVTLSANDSVEVNIFGNDSVVDDVTGEVLHAMSVTIGDITLDGFDSGMWIDYNTHSAIDIGAVTLNALTFPDLVQGEDYNVVSNFNSNNADLSINDNNGSEITITSVDLTAKNGYTSLNINNNNTNTYVDDGAEDGPDDSTVTDSAVSINIGDVTLTTRGTRYGGVGEDATVEIDNNVDNSDAVDASITLGNVSVSAYGYAGLYIHDNYDATITTGNLSSTGGLFAELAIDDEEYSTISIAGGGSVNLVSGEDLELQVTDSLDVKTTIGDVSASADQYLYVNVNNNDSEDVNSFVKIASIDSTAGDDAYVEINDNDAGRLAQLIEIGDVTINGDRDLYAQINDNDDSEIILGDVTFNADGEDYLRIENNDGASVTLGTLTMSTGDEAIANILYNDNANLDIGDISLTATDSDSSANVYIYNNENSDVYINSIETDAADYSRVAINSNYDNGGFGEDNTLIDINAGVDISVVSATSNDADAVFEINNNDMINAYSDDVVTVDIAGDISVAATNNFTGDAYADLEIDDNYFTTIDLGTATDSISVEATVTSAGANDAYANAGFNITDNVTLITMTDVAVHAHATTTGTNAEAYAIYSVRNNDLVNIYAQGAGVYQGDVEVTAMASAASGSQTANAYFEILDNDGYGYDYSSDDVVFNMEVDNVTVTTEGELGGAYVNVGATASDKSVDWGYAFDLSENDDYNWNADIVLGDVTVNAGNYAEVILSNDQDYSVINGEDSHLTVGNIDVTSGESADAATGDINLYLGDVIGAQTVTIDASAVDGSHVDVNIWDSEDVDSVTISGSYTNVFISGDQDSLNTLDLSGVDGFAYVETWDADLREGSAAIKNSDTLTIKIGNSDVQYNAMYGQDTGYPDGRDDWSSIVVEDGANADDQYGNPGWYNLAVTTNAVNQTQVIGGFENYGNNVVNDSSATFYNALQFNHNDVSYRIQVSNYHYDNDDAFDVDDNDGVNYSNVMSFAKLVNGSWVGLDEADVAYDLGIQDIAYSASGGDGTFTLTGYDDGARFDVVTDVYQVKDDQTDGDIYDGISGSPRNLVVNNSAGTFDGTSNDASEVFQFVGDTIGDIVIGGFNPEGFAGAYGNWTDRLDFSQFDGVNSVNDLTFSIDYNADGSDGWYDDVVIDFIDTDLGSIRLVGVGRFDTNAEDVINNVQSSILF